MGSGKSLPANIVCQGSARLPARPVPLRAGPLHLSWEAGTLRGIFLGTRELVKQIYVAVRDPNWVTVPGTISNLHIQRNRKSFLIRFRSTHHLKPVHFIWEAQIEGTADGSIRFEMNGAARSTFQRARIGICVLHPVDTCSGITCAVLRDHGHEERARFPKAIDPSAPAEGFHAMRALEHEVSSELGMRFRFEGDLFEMEDQRNWTDASFKTFSTPLHLPIPVEVERGTRIDQSVLLELTGTRPARETARISKGAVTLGLPRRSSGKLPRIGLGGASHLQPLSSREIRRLSQLGLSHLRVDVDQKDTEWQRRLDIAVNDAGRLGCSLEIALLNHVEDLPGPLKALRVPVSSWLLYPYSAALAAQLRKRFPQVPVAAGTNANFIAFNESPPSGKHIDLATFAIHPQTHAIDNASLVETLEIQGQLVEHARALTRGLPVIVSPVTLKPRFNPDAMEPEPPPNPGELPPQVDPRQMSLLGAGWTLGSLKYLAEAGARNVTFYETTGWRGVMELASGSALPHLFRSIPAAVFPMYHVFGWLAPFHTGSVLPLASDAPLRVVGLALRHRGQTRIVMANLTGDAQEVTFSKASRRARVQILDETNAVAAMSQPEAFGRQAGRMRRLDGLTLPRFSLARLDLMEND